MTKLLLDTNLAPRTATYLSERLGLDVARIAARGLARLRDREIAALAVREGRVIVSFALDFGELFHRRGYPPIGVIVLRVKDQTVDSVNRLLEDFFLDRAPTVPLDRSLVIIDDRRVRVVSGS